MTLPANWANGFIPPTPRTTAAMIAALAARAPGQIAARDGRAAITYADLDALTRGMAVALAEIPKGAVVALDLPVGLDLLVALAAVTRLGAVALHLHELLRPGEAAALLALARPVACIGSAFHRTGLPLLTIGELAREPGTRPVDAPSEQDLALLRTTSGSTGRPKLVRVPHRQLCQRLPWPGPLHIPGQIFACPHPYAFPSYQVLTVLGSGGAIVFRPAVTAAQIERFIADEHPTHFLGVPAMYEQVARAKHPPNADLSSLRAAIISAAHLPPSTKTAVEERWGVPLHQSYALSELGFLTESSPASPRESVGSCLPGVELRVADEAGLPLPPGAEGRIQARTDVPFAGYLSGEPSPVDGDGWFTTADLGRLDERGNLFLHGRAMDSINVGGFKVSALEVTEVLRAMPGIRDAHVFARPHPLRGEVVAAAAVVDPGLTTLDVRKYCRWRLARYKQPAEVYLLPTLPRNPLGKIDRRELLAMVERAR